MRTLVLLLLIVICCHGEFSVNFGHDKEVIFATAGINYLLYKDVDSHLFYYGNIIGSYAKFEKILVAQQVTQVAAAERIFAYMQENGNTTVCLFAKCETLDGMIDVIGVHASASSKTLFKNWEPSILLLAKNLTIYRVNASREATITFEQLSNITVPQNMTRIMQATNERIFALLGNSTVYELVTQQQMQLASSFVVSDYSSNELLVFDSTNTLYYISPQVQLDAKKQYRMASTHVQACNKEVFLKNIGTVGYLRDQGDRFFNFNVDNLNHFYCPVSLCTIRVMNKKIATTDCFIAFEMHKAGLLTTSILIGGQLLVLVTALLISISTLFNKKHGCSSGLCIGFSAISIYTLIPSAFYLAQKLSNRENEATLQTTLGIWGLVLFLCMLSHGALLRHVKRSMGQVRLAILKAQVFFLLSNVLTIPQNALNLGVMSSLDFELVKASILIGIICGIQLLSFGLQLIALYFTYQYRKLLLQQEHDAVVLSVLYEKLENEAEPLVSQSLASIKSFEIPFSSLSSFQELGSGAQGNRH